MSEASRKFRMTMLDVGQGDAIYFEFPNGGNLLVDAGKGGEGDRGRWVVTPFLKSKGVNALELLAISHPQEDHIGGMGALMDDFRVKNVLDAGSVYHSNTFERLKKKITEENAPYFHARSQDEIQGFRDVEIKVIHPPAGFASGKSVNNESLVLKINYKEASFLMTGDIQETAIKALLANTQELQADVLKVPHHGAKMGALETELIKAVNPKISVISVGERNAFHHPAESTLQTLSAVPGNKIYRTDRDHAIVIESDGRNLTVL